MSGILMHRNNPIIHLTETIVTTHLPSCLPVQVDQGFFVRSAVVVEGLRYQVKCAKYNNTANRRGARYAMSLVLSFTIHRICSDYLTKPCTCRTHTPSSHSCLSRAPHRTAPHCTALSTVLYCKINYIMPERRLTSLSCRRYCSGLEVPGCPY